MPKLSAVIVCANTVIGCVNMTYILTNMGFKDPEMRYIDMWVFGYK